MQRSWLTRGCHTMTKIIIIIIIIIIIRKSTTLWQRKMFDVTDATAFSWWHNYKPHFKTTDHEAQTVHNEIP